MKKLIWLFFFIGLLGCDKKEKEAAPSEHLVTGFNFTDKNGNPLYKAGNPNVQTSAQVNGNTVHFTIYPNPSPAETAFMIECRDSTALAQMRIWVVAAPQGDELKSYNYPNSNQSLIGGQPVWDKTIPLPYGNNKFIADLRPFPAGAYRIYIQTDKIKLWDNILKE